MDEDTRCLVEPLAARGISVAPAVWDDRRVDWSAFDLAVVRSCWDYVGRQSGFLAWARSVPRLSNPAEVLAWNTDKRYLIDLRRNGVPIVSTTWLESGRRWTPPAQGLWVIKPAVSIASLDTGRYRLDDPDERRLAQAQVNRLLEQGRTVMVQPYMSRIDESGETSLVFFGGRFSHAVRKAAVLDGPDTGIDRRFMAHGGLTLQRCGVTAQQLALAEHTLSSVPGGSNRLLYARVDLIAGEDGEPTLLELELTEPQLYLKLVPGAAERFAAVICDALDAVPARRAVGESEGQSPSDNTSVASPKSC